MRISILAAGLAAMMMLPTVETVAQQNVMDCRPYMHGDLRPNSLAFFCLKEEGARAYIAVFEGKRTGELTKQQARERFTALQGIHDCIFAEVSHISRRTVIKATGPAPYCKKFGKPATVWPSLVEAELSGDGAQIWVLTNALVPPPEPAK